MFYWKPRRGKFEMIFFWKSNVFYIFKIFKINDKSNEINRWSKLIEATIAKKAKVNETQPTPLLDLVAAWLVKTVRP